MNTWHLQIREIYPEEYHFLKEFLYQAIYLPQGVEPPPRSVVEHPELQVYIADFGTQCGDYCLVAEADGTILNVEKNDGGVTGEQTYIFAMPASDVTVTGVFRKISTEFTLSPSTLEFEVYEGYTSDDVEPVTVTITNTGDLDVTFEGSYALPTSQYYDIQPAEGGWGGINGREITIVPGGKGYTGVVNEVGEETTSENGLPEPGYYITLPDELNEILGGDPNAIDLSKILKFTYKDDLGRTREWNLELYGTEAHSSDVESTEQQRYIYRIQPGKDEAEQNIPVRLQLTDSEDNIIISDKFTPTLESQYQEYKMSLYSGDLEPANITAEIDLGNGRIVYCGVTRGIGTLLVRGLTDKNTTTEIIRDEAALSGDEIAVLAPAGVTYYVNGSNVEVANSSGVKLLVDKVLDNDVLTNYIKTNMAEQIPSGNYAYEQQYLDLVDTKNGNAYLTIDTDARQKMTIYWPVPKDFDSDNSFYIVHFETLDRNYDYLDEALSADSPKIIPSELVNIAGTKYVKFETGSFSPFVLVYEKKSSSEGSTHDNYPLRYDTNGSETIKSESKNSSWTKKYEELPVPVRDGYTFEGWYFDSKLTELVEDDIRINRSTITLYAGWSKNMSHPNNNGVSSWLNSEEHDSYLNGYGNGTFGPNNNW